MFFQSSQTESIRAVTLSQMFHHFNWASKAQTWVWGGLRAWIRVTGLSPEGLLWSKLVCTVHRNPDRQNYCISYKNWLQSGTEKLKLRSYSTSSETTPVVMGRHYLRSPAVVQNRWKRWADAKSHSHDDQCGDYNLSFKCWRTSLDLKPFRWNVFINQEEEEVQSPLFTDLEDSTICGET